jgi:hypothetical protein
MSRSVYEGQDSSRENKETQSSLTPDQDSGRTGTAEHKTDYGKSVKPLEKTGGITRETERIANLSTEITELLLSMQQKVETSAERFRSLESAADAKKEELRRLHEIEVSAASLASLVESHGLEKDRFEILMSDHRGLWEKEIEQRAQGEKEYLEALQFRREQEEEEYWRVWAIEKEKARNALKSELEALQQEFKKKQEALEKDLLQREASLRVKEKECDEIIREMEMFISGLGKRVQIRVEAAAHLSTEELLAQSAFEDEIIGGNGSPMSVEEKDALMEAAEAEDSGSEATEVAQTQNTDSVTIM